MPVSPIFVLSKPGKYKQASSLKPIESEHCGVMKFLADMPSRLEGGDHRINEK